MNCLEAVIKCLYVVAADRNVSGRAVLHGVAKQMSTYKFVMVTHFLADAMGGWVNQAYSRLSTTHGHITDCKMDSVVHAGVGVVI